MVPIDADETFGNWDLAVNKYFFPPNSINLINIPSTEIRTAISKVSTPEIEQFLGKLNIFRVDDKGLREFAYEVSRRGPHHSELDEYLAMLVDGAGIHHPSIIRMVGAVINDSPIGTKLRRLNVKYPRVFNFNANTILYRERGDYQYAHVKAMKDLIRVYGEHLDGFIQDAYSKDRRSKGLLYLNIIVDAINFTQEMVTEYRGIFEKIEAIDKSHNREDSDHPSPEYSILIKQFVNNWDDKFNSLGKIRAKSIEVESQYKELAQRWSTIYFLTGVAMYNRANNPSKEGFVLKLLPIELMDKNILQAYLKKFEVRLYDSNKVRVTTDDAYYNLSYNEIFELTGREFNRTMRGGNPTTQKYQ